MSRPLESVIETYLKEQIKFSGGLCYKFKSTVNGVPDQLIVYNGNMYLVEVKRPNEVLRPSQVHIHKQISEKGVTVYTVDSVESIDNFLRDVLDTVPIVKEVTRSKPKIKSIDMFKTN